MELIRYSESDNNTNLTVRQDRTRITAERSKRGVRLIIASQAGRNECDRVEASIELCLSCDDYDRLLCQLSRLQCGCEPCECRCEDDEPILVPVSELRKAMKGCSADDLIEISDLQ